MQFHTEYIATPSTLRLNPQKPILLIGSCFSDRIGFEMRRSLWDARVNPCGTLFNPSSISSSILKAIRHDLPIMSYQGDLWLSWDFPTFYSDPDQHTAERQMLLARQNLELALKETQAIIVTFGTSIVYEKSGVGIVANCHKAPARDFNRKMLSICEIVNIWISTLHDLREFHPDVPVIFTVSPVRHLREGFVENSVSKSNLILACHELTKTVANTYYFPSYEIIIDDLRDYRFFETDMIHPSTQASSYVWEKFKNTYLNLSDIEILNEGAKLHARISHKILHPATPSGRQFIESTSQLIDEFKSKYPGMILPE